jgi:hypothetical protein
MRRAPRFQRHPVAITWWEIVLGGLAVAGGGALLVACVAILAGSLGIIGVALEGAPR